MTDSSYPLALRFRSLLDNHRSLCHNAAPPRRETEATLQGHRSLLSAFTATFARATLRSADEAHDLHSRFRTVVTAHNDALARHRERQHHTADDFNLLDVLHVVGDENRHSRVLAWLLDHDLRREGTHAQGNLGFRLFLDACSLPTKLADEPYVLRREVSGHESRIDLEVVSRGRFLLHIENKIWSTEGIDQTTREWSDLQRRARQFNIDPTVRRDSVMALYLTPTGRAPAHPAFRPISWRNVATALDRFADVAQPADVKLFARHYAAGLRRFIISNATEEAPHDV